MIFSIHPPRPVLLWQCMQTPAKASDTGCNLPAVRLGLQVSVGWSESGSVLFVPLQYHIRLKSETRRTLENCAEYRRNATPLWDDVSFLGSVMWESMRIESAR